MNPNTVAFLATRQESSAGGLKVMFLCIFVPLRGQKCGGLFHLHFERR
jgi:hypothetical protein